VEAVAAIAERMGQIQSRIAQVTAPRTSFDMVLGEAVIARDLRVTPGTTSEDLPTAAVTAASAVSSGADRVDAKGIPIELKAYGNGRVPAEALSTISGTSHQLWSPAARSFEAMQAAAAAEGVTIGITDSYRTYESQVDLVARKGLYSQGGLAASPGTSMHGWGVALDLRLDASAQAWMRSNGGRYGFVENVPREPWHWQYKPTS
jgi:LAS superfamily LD-carboxypeptidase LdcB